MIITECLQYQDDTQGTRVRVIMLSTTSGNVQDGKVVGRGSDEVKRLSTKLVPGQWRF